MIYKFVFIIFIIIVYIILSVFLDTGYVKDKFPLSKFFKKYYEYIKEQVRPYVEFSNVRNPSDFCNRIILPPKFTVVLYPNGTLGTKPIEQFHQTPTPSHSVDQRTFYNFFEQPSSSSGVGLNIDLNKPSLEDEGN